MGVADLVLPVFAIIVTGWLAGWLGYISRSLADGLVHFAYNVAMPALLIVTIAQEEARNLLEWRFLLAFGGGSILCFALVFVAVRAGWKRDLASSTMHGMTAAMTNTGFVALPILHSIYGQPAVLPAAIATMSSCSSRRSSVAGRSMPRTRIIGYVPTFRCRSEALLSTAILSRSLTCISLGPSNRGPPHLGPTQFRAGAKCGPSKPFDRISSSYRLLAAPVVAVSRVLTGRSQP